MRFLTSLYSKLFLFYPASDRHKFGDEQLGVFLDRVSEAKKYGFWRLFRFWIKEYLALIIDVFLAYINSMGENRMLTEKRIFLTNLGSFVSSFILIAVVNFIGRYGVNSLSVIPKPMDYFLWLFFVGLIMAFCGWFISKSIFNKKRLIYALIFGLGYVFSNLLTNTTLLTKIGIPFGTSWDTFCVNCSPMIQGLVIGFFFGLVWKGWRLSAFTGLAKSSLVG